MPYARVKDAKSSAAKATASGGKIINGPMEVPGGDWIAQGIDPQGAMFAVHSLKPAVQKVAAAVKTATKVATAVVAAVAVGAAAKAAISNRQSAIRKNSCQCSMIFEVTSIIRFVS